MFIFPSEQLIESLEPSAAGVVHIFLVNSDRKMYAVVNEHCDLFEDLFEDRVAKYPGLRNESILPGGSFCLGFSESDMQVVLERCLLLERTPVLFTLPEICQDGIFSWSCKEIGLSAT